ncbi:hypothetical protein OPV22_007282 [Ensete ventricosum]|uniref:Uncharacterized protein n=1 Tax=Ensete ventricosum TaxID=4639 RepID=A0AAV8Q871_ENSVE|nr:hypothetical protein OPV22_007282 [Ensete ventricosum]
MRKWVDGVGCSSSTSRPPQLSPQPARTLTAACRWAPLKDKTGEGAHNVDEIPRSIKDSREHDDLCLDHKLDLTEAL